MAQVFLLVVAVVAAMAVSLADAAVVKMVEYPAYQCGYCRYGEICAGFHNGRPYCQKLVEPELCQCRCRYPWQVCTSTGIVCIREPCPSFACVSRQFYPPNHFPHHH